jgi:hypothetical protein
MKNTFIGTPMERREDMRFLRGRGEYVDDVAVPGLLYAVILRSSVAHGRLVSIDASAALKVPGVHSVITAADMPGGPPIVPMRLQPLPEFKPFEQPVIAHDKVRYVGEPLAVVLATSVAIGEDALEKIAVEIAPLPAVTSCAAVGQNESLLFESQSSNCALTFAATRGDAGAAFATAPYVHRERFELRQRLQPHRNDRRSARHVLGGDHGVDARQRERRRCIDRNDAAVGDRTAQDRRMEQAIGREIVHVGAAAAHEAQVLAPLDRGADEGVLHAAPFL